MLAPAAWEMLLIAAAVGVETGVVVGSVATAEGARTELVAALVDMKATTCPPISAWAAWAARN